MNILYMGSAGYFSWVSALVSGLVSAVENSRLGMQCPHPKKPGIKELAQPLN